MRNAFVKINRSKMPHNAGQLFYTVCRTDEAGVLWNVLDPMEYPFFWGFSNLDHALAVADNYNGPYENVISSVLAKRFADEEREAA